MNQQAAAIERLRIIEDSGRSYEEGAEDDMFRVPEVFSNVTSTSSEDNVNVIVPEVSTGRG